MVKQWTTTWYVKLMWQNIFLVHVELPSPGSLKLTVSYGVLQHTSLFTLQKQKVNEAPLVRGLATVA